MEECKYSAIQPDNGCTHPDGAGVCTGECSLFEKRYKFLKKCGPIDYRKCKPIGFFGKGTTGEQIVDAMIAAMSDEEKKTPKRIQRKGFRETIPAGAKLVARPSRWGNPFSLKEYDRATSLKLYDQWLNDKLETDPTFLDPLKGKDLCCYCELGEDCHADILLRKIAEQVK